jgi:hypothetical protein
MTLLSLIWQFVSTRLCAAAFFLLDILIGFCEFRMLDLHRAVSNYPATLGQLPISGALNLLDTQAYISGDPHARFDAVTAPFDFELD